MIFPRPFFNLFLLLAVCFTLATALQPFEVKLDRSNESDSILKTVLGDGRRMFANHFFVKADVYFHSGYYPSLIEQGYAAAPAHVHIAERHDNGKDEKDDDEKEPGANFLGKSTDWIDAFGRHFYSSTHSHLDKPGDAREILPWLRLSADLDPQKIDTYTVASYWLRHNIGKPVEAEEFLREGMRANPDSYEILFELGQLYDENYRDPNRARNVWELSMRRWKEQEAAGKKPDKLIYDQILSHLANLEEKQGNLQLALDYLNIQLGVTPSPESIQNRIAELQQKLTGRPSK